jgi:hypothetical protein
VWGKRGRRPAGEFAGRRASVLARSATILPDWSAGTGCAAGASALAAPNTQKQTLSALDQSPVASGSSPRQRERQQIQRFRLPCRLIASYRTDGDRRAHAGRSKPVGAIGDGVRPPRLAARRSYACRSDQAQNLANPASTGLKSSTNRLPHDECHDLVAAKGAETSNPRMGSGVRGGATRVTLPANASEGLAGRSDVRPGDIVEKRVGGGLLEHHAFDLARTATLESVAV